MVTAKEDGNGQAVKLAEGKGKNVPPSKLEGSTVLNGPSKVGSQTSLRSIKNIARRGGMPSFERATHIDIEERRDGPNRHGQPNKERGGQDTNGNGRMVQGWRKKRGRWCLNPELFPAVTPSSGPKKFLWQTMGRHSKKGAVRTLIHDSNLGRIPQA